MSLDFCNRQIDGASLSGMNLTPLSKRICAYFIDSVSIFFVFLILLILVNVAISPSYIEKTHYYASGSSGEYQENIFYKEDSLTIIKVELFKNGESLYRGDIEEYKKFVDQNNIRFKEETGYRFISHPSHDFHDLLQIVGDFSYVLACLLALGLTNIITALELWIFKGLTLGKKIVGIKVERKDGKKFGFVDAILRDALIKGLANMATLGILNIISLILSVVTADNKTIHDLVAKTKVENLAENLAD